MDLYASMRWAEYDRRAARKSIDSIVAPVKQPEPPVNAIVALPRRIVTIIAPVDLDEHDHQLARVASAPAVAPVLGTIVPKVEAVAEPDEFAGYTQASFDALQKRKGVAREHSESDASRRQSVFGRLAERTKPTVVREAQASAARVKLFERNHKSAPASVSPVATAALISHAHRKEVREAEEQAWAMYGHLFTLDHPAKPTH
jgi:hypothetical protein